MVFKFRDYEKNPIDLNNEDDLVEIVEIVISAKRKHEYFKRWSKESLLSEGWIQLQTLLNSWDESKGVSFPKYCFMYLGSRISDGMSSFEEGMVRNNSKTSGGSNRYIHKTEQFMDLDLPHANECNGISEYNNPLDADETMVESMLNKPYFSDKEKFIIRMIAKGVSFKSIGYAMGVSESRISQRCKTIRSRIYE